MEDLLKLTFSNYKDRDTPDALPVDAVASHFEIDKEQSGRGLNSAR